MIRHRRHLLAIGLVLTMALGTLGAGAATAAEPSRIVGEFHQSLLAVMKDAKSLGVGGRYQRLEPSIVAQFHLPLMIQVASGSYWRRATPEQTEKLISAFTRLSVSTYASRFDGYSGQTFVTEGERPGPQQTTLVKARIDDPGAAAVKITYVTKKIKGRWRIIDVLVDKGISELAVRRSEYRRVLQSGGIDGLIATLNDKADELLKN